MALKQGKLITETVEQNNCLGNVSATVTRYSVHAAAAFHIPYEGADTAVKAEFPQGFCPSYGSGLTFKGKGADGALEFYGLTDRGPNGDGPMVKASLATPGATGTIEGKLFPAPGFTPSVGLISVGKHGAVLESVLPLKFSNKVNASGLPVAPGKLGSSDEVPLTDAARYAPASGTTFSDHGVDTEAIALDAALGVLWVADEYGPFILKIDPVTGVILKKYQPGPGAADLPAVLALRRANRGIEGLALDKDTGKLHGFIQSPLDDGKAFYTVPGATVASNENIRDYAGFIRWIEFDTTTEKTRLYAYPIDSTQYAAGKTGHAKLGDLVSLGGGKFIVIEQGIGADEKMFNHLMLVHIPTAVSDIAAINSDLEKSSMTGTAVNAADYAHVITLKRNLLFDLNGAGWLAEKAEGLALVDEHTLALASDDDFGMKTVVVNRSGAIIAGADITECTVDASGAIATIGSAVAADGAAGITVRVGRGTETVQSNWFWLIRFNRKLADFNVPD